MCAHLDPQEIGTYLWERLTSLSPRITAYGPAPGDPRSGGRGRASLVAFNVEGLHATDVSTLLDHAGAREGNGGC